MLFAAATEATGKQPIEPFSHVRDAYEFHVFDTLHIPLPYPVSKFLILLLLAAVIVAWLMIWLANKIHTGESPRGKLWNLLEGLLFFVRDKIARPSLGEKDADKYMPFLASLFLFILLCNLFGMIPFLGSPTAHIYVTSALALVSFVYIHASGIGEHGVGKYLKTFIPHIHLEGGFGMKVFGFVLMIGMALLEYATAFIRVIVLSVRLFANMLAGHTVLFMILFFIKMVDDPAYSIPVAQDWMYWPVALFSVVLTIALSLLELFIAGLQAFIFTFLTAIFIGLAKHPPH
jgi:F-type H+-transporting ATPase subunit a